MRWFLHRCAEAAIPVPEYRDEPAGSMTDESHPLHKAGQSMITAGHFTQVTLKPVVRPERKQDTTRAAAMRHLAQPLFYRPVGEFPG